MTRIERYTAPRRRHQTFSRATTSVPLTPSRSSPPPRTRASSSFDNQSREAIPQRGSTPFFAPYGASLPARSTKQFSIHGAKVICRWCSRVGVLTLRTRYHQGVFFAAVVATVFHDVFSSFLAVVLDTSKKCSSPAMPLNAGAIAGQQKRLFNPLGTRKECRGKCLRG
jgi:hypothetical protein